MKKLRIIFIVGVIAALAVLLAACGAPPLPSPQNLTVNEQTLQLSWDEVDGAKSYIVSFGGEERTTRRNTYSLSNLAAGAYGVKVRAVGDGDKASDSAWSSEIMFVRPVESGLSYRLINSNTEYEVSGMGTAGGEVVVDSVYRGKPVTRIGDSAFYNSGKLTSITIGENVKSIGVRAFYNCSYLQQVVIPEGVTEIGEYAFQNCRALTSIKLPNTVTKINPNTFSLCRALAEVEFGTGVTEIGRYAFTSCGKLENVVIPETITFIDEYAFSDCVEKDDEGKVTGGLKSVTICGATELGGYAFNRCGALTAIDMGKALKTIGTYAFSDCDALNNVVVPDNVETIKEYAFYNCDALDTIKIGSGVTSIGMSAFRATKLWNDVASAPSSAADASTYGLVYADKWLVGNKDAARSAITIAADTVGIGAYALSAMSNSGIQVSLPDSLKYIGDYAFAGCSGLPGIALKNVERVGDAAFYNCENLGSFSFRESLRSIGSYAFAYCKYLNNPTTTFSENFESIGSYAFYGTKFWEDATNIVYCSNWVVGFKDGSAGADNSGASLKANTLGISDFAFYGSSTLKSISIPDSVKRIGTGAFRECYYLLSVRLPAELEQIKPFTFYKCYSLVSVVWPKSLNRIGRSAFYNCISLEEIVIPDSVKEIDDYAFYNLSLASDNKIIGTEKIVFGSGVEKIGNYAFAYTVTVKEIVIPDNVKELGVHVFDNCGFESVTIGTGLESISDYAFRNCENLTELIIPGNVKYIGRYAFKNCSALKKLTIADGVENIGQYAFSSCSALIGLAIPESVKYIDNYAFCKCKALQSLNIGAYVDYVGRHSFYGSRNMTVYFEGETIPDEWNEYWNSSYRPVVFGAELSDDKTVVLSITLKDDGILYHDALNGISAPVRPLEYDCAGWATAAGGEVEIRTDEIVQTETGKKLYPVWQEYVEPEPDTEPEPEPGESEEA